MEGKEALNGETGTQANDDAEQSGDRLKVCDGGRWQREWPLEERGGKQRDQPRTSEVGEQTHR